MGKGKEGEGLWAIGYGEEGKGRAWFTV